MTYQAFLATSLALAATAVQATPVTHYSGRQLNSGGYVNYSPEYASSGYTGAVRDFSGAATEGSFADSRTWAYGNGSGGYVFKKETSDVYAKADLATGELKARASLGLGAAQPGSAEVPAFGTRATTASASAVIADSMSFRSGSSAYIWSAGDQFTFRFGVDGTVDIPSSIQSPATNSSAMTWATLRLDIWKPGGLEAISQLSNFDYGGYADQHGQAAAWTEYVRLSEVVNGLAVKATAWCLGETRTVAGFCGGPFYQQATLGSTPTLLTHTFQPGGDFEWTLELSTRVVMDLSYENLTASLDFSHTIHTAFTAPDGAVTYSASGLLPNTLPISAVPEPQAWALMLGGLLGLGAFRRLLPGRKAT